MIQFKIFQKNNLIQGISDTRFGSMKKKKRILKFLLSLTKRKISLKNLVCAEQVFGKKVHFCQLTDSGQTIKKADGLLTNLPGQILAIISADCVPIFLFDSKKQVVGVLHGSRVSLIKGIVEEAVKKIKDKFNSQATDLWVGIGPHLRKCHYELAPSLIPVAFKKYLIQSANKYYFDLTALVFDKLKKLGIPKNQIEDCQVCTFCQFQKYFSNRRQQLNPQVYAKKKARFVSVFGLTRRVSKLNKTNQKFLIKEAVNLLKQGGVLVCPTDTVYGLLADATNQKAVARIFALKKRSTSKALPIFVRDLKMAKKLAQIYQRQEVFLKKVWPGQVTVVLKRKKGSKIYGVKPNTIALRIPNNSFLQQLLTKFNRPLIATSANLSGEPASTHLQDIFQQFKDQDWLVDLFIEADTKPKRPSLIVDLIGEEIKILRK